MFKKTLFIVLAISLVLSLLLSGCSGGSKSDSKTPSGSTNPATAPTAPRGATGTISTGKVVQVDPIPVSANGGSFTLNQPESPLNGMILGVPPGSYSKSLEFKISYAPIEKHTFGEAFNPITPLIKIDNGGGYAEEIMEVKIPVKVPAGSFAMGFIYDEKTKTLEGLPTLAQDADSITVATRHFSDILISEISEEVLQNKDIDSHFRPGIDDWQFVNYGSYIARGGHCTGQSMTAMWYYETQPDGKDLTLYNRYDNNSLKPATPDLWEDDSYGYRFASVVWKEMDWGSWGRKLTEKYVAQDDRLTWNLFAYSMLVTGEPQMTEIWNTKVGGGHAMIVYRIFQNNLYIADPNYPANVDRRIEYAGGKFKPYNSGENADEIKKGNGKDYDRITYCAKTSLIDWNSLSAHWQEVKNGSIGNSAFPAYQIVWIDDKGVNHELKDGYVSPTKLITITATSNMLLAGEKCGGLVYRDSKMLKFDAKGAYELLSGENKLGIYILALVPATDKDGKPTTTIKYIDFKYLTVTYSGLSIDPSSLDGEPNKSYTFTAKLDSALANAVYDWSVNGASVQKNNSNTLIKSFPSEGKYDVSVKVLDSAGKELGTAKSAVNIQPKAANNAGLLQKFNTVRGYPGGGKYTFDITTPQGSSTNTQNITLEIPYGTYGPLKIAWNGTSFTGKINYSKDSTTYTAEVNGTVSSDGTVLQSFSYKGTQKVGNTASDKLAYIRNHTYTFENLQLFVTADNATAKGKTPPQIVNVVEEYREGKLEKKTTFKSMEMSATSENYLLFSFTN